MLQWLPVTSSQNCTAYENELIIVNGEESLHDLPSVLRVIRIPLKAKILFVLMNQSTTLNHVASSITLRVSGSLR